MRIQDVDALQKNQAADVLKHNAIDRYCAYIVRLQKGYLDDYSTIMDIISLLDIPRNTARDMALTQYLINKRP